jgi:hypothetical protein
MRSLASIFLVGAGAVSLLLASCASAPATSETGPAGTPAAEKVSNIALGKSITSNGHIYDFVAQNAVDGEPLSYFEGPANSFPNLITIDLGQPSTVKSMTLKLNPKRIWQARVQTLEVQSSDDGTTFATVVPKADYQFDPEENGNSVTIPWEGKTQYLRLVVTANTEATAAQIAEWEVNGR